MIFKGFFILANRLLFRYLLMLLSFLWSLSFISMVQAEERGSQASTPIIGGGAHFSWVIFNELKPELEKLLDRDIELYGTIENYFYSGMILEEDFDYRNCMYILWPMSRS